MQPPLRLMRVTFGVHEMKAGVIRAIAYVVTAAFLFGCGDEPRNDNVSGTGEPGNRRLADGFDVYSVGGGMDRIALNVSLPADAGPRRFDVVFYGKDHMISCTLRENRTGQEHSAPLVPNQIAALNDAIRQDLSRASFDQLAKDKLVWERWEINTRRKYEFPIDIGSDKAVVAVFNRVIELSNLPRYNVKPGDTLMSIAQDVLGDAGRWKEIRDVNPYLGEDGRNLNHAFDIRVPRQ